MKNYADRLKVVAGGIVRNRGWVLSDSINSLKRQTFPPHQISYLTGDNKDDTELVLAGNGVHWWVHNTGYPGFERRESEWNPVRYSIPNLAMLRNIWCSEHKDASHLFTVDSDMILNPNVLELLLSLDVPIAGAVMPGCPPLELWDYQPFVPPCWFPKRTHEEVHHKEPFNVACLCGCYLLRKDFLDLVNWEPFADDEQGEDVGLARKAKDLGVKMVAHPFATGEHRMHKA